LQKQNERTEGYAAERLNIFAILSESGITLVKRNAKSIRK